MLALLVAPAPDGYLKQSALKFLNPYLNLLFIQNDWGFFSPVGLSAQVQYLVVDKAGVEHAFEPTQQFGWYDPTALWKKDRIRTVSSEPAVFADGMAAFLCKKHAELNAETIVLIKIDQQREFLPEDHLNGMHPMDSDFSLKEELKRHTCSSV